MGCVVNIPLSVWERRRSYETQDKRNRIRKKLDYLSFQLARDFRFGKEIRLYHLGPFLSALSNRLFGEYRREREKVEQRSLAVAAFGFFVVLVRDGAAYAFLIGKALSGGDGCGRIRPLFFGDFADGGISVGSDMEMVRN